MKNEVIINLTLPVLSVAICLLAAGPLAHPVLFGCASLALMAGGLCLLFAARRPLYQQRRFFSFGSGELDRPHRKLYRAAYVLLWSGAFFALIVLAVMSWRPG
jgi:hypothetical protein